MILKFEEWLTNQQARDDRIGDFARVLSRAEYQQKFSRRRWDEHKGWAEIVSRITEPGHIPAFNQAWQEFILAKEAASDSLD
ncbi:MAG TPA: hypothetical protein VI451_05980 [Anaerolineales bacterium]|jgi:hypothetical protein|nr:hypothetical protein [Anaerolineales bacterium]